jgi:hypothetical protein
VAAKLTETGRQRKAAGAGKRGPLPGFRERAQAAEKQAARDAKALAKARKLNQERIIDEAIQILSEIAMCVKEARELGPKMSLRERFAAMSAGDRENPAKLHGDMLRDYAFRRGLAKSAVATLSDEKIRTELRYITQRQYEAEAA